MTITVPTTTTDCITTSNYCNGCYSWPCQCSRSATIGYYQWSVPVEPTECIGKAHVFECAHVTSCKCGAIERVMGKSAKGKKR